MLYGEVLKTQKHGAIKISLLKMARKSNGTNGAVASSSMMESPFMMDDDESNPYAAPKHVTINEEEIARIQEIFKPFDDTGKGKAPIDDFPTIMRLLNFNLPEG